MAAKKQNNKPQVRYRMYGLVPYNISEIQKGIQFGHAVVEYANAFSKDKDYQAWAQNDKTFIILNGGTTNNGNMKTNTPGPTDFGTLVEAFSEYRNGTPSAKSVKFVLEVGTMQQHFITLHANSIKFAYFQEPDLNNSLTAIVFLADERVFDKSKYPDMDSFEKNKTYKSYWTKQIGGTKNAFLRDFLTRFKLA